MDDEAHRRRERWRGDAGRAPPMTTAIAARASMAVSTPAVPSAHAIAGRSREAPPDLCGYGLRLYRV